jgi:hexosaminidase
MSRLASSCVLFCVLTALLVLPGRVSAQQGSGPTADELAIRWGVDSNLIEEGSRFRSTLTLRNRGEKPLRGAGWTLYFNFLREIPSETVEGPVRLRRINGDFYALEPGDDFSSLSSGEQLEISFEAPGSAIKRIDAPAGFYVVFTGPEGKPEPPAPVTDVTVEPFTRPEQTKRGPNDVWPVPTPEWRYQENADLTARPADSVGRIVPTPASTEGRGGTVRISAEASVK